MSASPDPATPADAPVLRRFVPADVAALHAMTVSFGWPYRAEDVAFAAARVEGVAAETAEGLAGTAFCWRHGAEAAMIGLVCVHPGRQGRGIGRRLMQEAVGLAGERTAVLHATEAGAPLYRSMGFRDAGLIWQRQGVPGEVPAPVLRPGETLHPMAEGALPVLAALDRGAFGADRTPMLAALVQGGADGVVLRRGDRVAGFALRHRFGRGEVVGPVVAPDAAAAQAMILHLMARRGHGFVRIDVTEESGLSPWLAGPGL